MAKNHNAEKQTLFQETNYSKYFWIIFQIIVLFILQFVPILCSKDTLPQLGTKDIMDNDKTKSLINELEEIKYKLNDKE